jgi:uncharacterized protein
MRRLVLVLALVACHSEPPPALPAPAPVAAAPAAPPTPEAIARAFVMQVVAHDFAGAATHFDDRMRAGLPVDKLAAAWAQLEQAVGPFTRIGAVANSERDGMHVVSFDGQFAKAHLDLVVVVADDGRLAGFRIVPGKVAAAPWQPPPYVHPDTYVERAVTVGSSPPLPGTLTLPKGAGPFPAVVLVHGSGPNDADETIGQVRVFADLAAGLASRGIAVLRYVKRTRVDPSPEAYRTQHDEVDAAAHAAVALLAATPEIDPHRIVLAGHSQGGYLAPRMAAADPAIRAIAILAGPTRSLEDSLLAQLRYLAAQSPGDAHAAELVTAAEAFKHTVEDPKLAPDATLTFPIGGVTMPASYFLDVRDYHPDAVAAKLAIPIAVIQGGRDYQVTAADDLPGWQRALAHHRNAKFFTYPALDHGLVAGTGPSTPHDYDEAAHVDAQLVSDLAAWILALPR